ncbi:kinase-like domain-containing protein [Irpex lacteus]|nr:kinase-like domain-containing protein [Irpex lacteus]
MLTAARRVSRTWRLTRSINTIQTKKPIEEEGLSWYKPDYFYPVKVGQVFESRYEVLGKLGHGAYSTTWLARDLKHERKHVALKAGTLNSVTPATKRESEIFRHLNSIQSKHVGRTLIRTSTDEFEIRNEHGTYKFIVQPPMALDLQTFRSRFPGRRLPEGLLKGVVEHVLLALDFLHEEAKVIHTDVQENNILLGISPSDPSFEEFASKEQSNPSPHKALDPDHIIYTSRNLHPNSFGRPVLCDFGEARYIQEEGYSEDIQPIQYRAPEVILGVPWNEKVDVWSVGVMIWDLFEAKHLFPLTVDSQDTNADHLARMVALLGPPPLDLLCRSNTKIPWQYFTEEGKWKGVIDIPKDSLETSEENLSGGDKTTFLKFVRRMLQWRPEDRSSARELLEDTWLQKHD